MRKAKPRKKSNQTSLVLKAVFIVVPLILIVFILNGISSLPFISHAEQTLVCPTPEPGQKTLQLSPCYLVKDQPSPAEVPAIASTPLPTSVPKSSVFCESDSIEQNGCTCPSYEEEDKICDDAQCFAHGGFPFFLDDLDNTTGLPAGSNCTFENRQAPAGVSCVTECNSKPIIYLYPQKTTDVDVLLDIPGIVTVSDPLYPQGGWKHVEAHPDGSLVYKNKTYHELYYESATEKATYPTKGFMVKTADLSSALTTFTTRLGLIGNEQQEFLDYWIPRLEKEHAPYFFVSILDQQQKEKVDHVIIFPKPDTRIEFLAYFKPVQHPYAVEPLIFPTVPARKGFVEVEWGGTVDQ